MTEDLSKIELVRATIDDVPVLLDLEKSVAGTKLYSPLLEEDEWEEELQKNEIYLIKKGTETVGSIAYEKKGEGYFYISGLVVDPQFQRRGFGRAALEKLIEKFKRAKRIDLVTHPDNPALKLYQSLGFVVESRQENYYQDGEPRLVLSKGNPTLL